MEASEFDVLVVHDTMNSFALKFLFLESYIVPLLYFVSCCLHKLVVAS